MNNRRRSVITKIFRQLIDIREKLEVVLEEENEVKENFPKSFHQTDRYEEIEEACFNLNQAFADIEDAIDSLGSIN